MRKFLSRAQAPKLLGISRIAVYKKIKNGKIKAIRVGKNFAILKGSLMKYYEAKDTIKRRGNR